MDYADGIDLNYYSEWIIQGRLYGPSYFFLQVTCHDMQTIMKNMHLYLDIMKMFFLIQYKIKEKK